eukprot:scaffold7967_cov75-Cylindrotheca_fusiformis.AAC.2
MSEEPQGTVHSFEIDSGADEDDGSMIDNSVKVNDDAGNNLPSVEEARETIPHKRVTPPAKKNRMFCFAFMGLIIVALVVTIIVLALELKDEKNQASIQSHKETLKDFLVEKEISTAASLRAPYSPQSQALYFLAEEKASKKLSSLYDNALNEQRIIERYVLAVLYFALIDNGEWNPGYSFLTTQDYCRWYQRVIINNDVILGGVRSCNDDGYVTDLHLSLLQSLQLTSNDISGDFPSGILNLPNLKILALGNNKFKGTIPIGLGDLSELSVLALSGNSFEGKVPSALGQLSALTNLQLDDNSLSGNLDQFLTNLDDLSWLDLQGNSFTGSLNWLDGMDQLTILDVSSNKIGGQIPGSLVNHPTLQLVDIHGNTLTGDLPAIEGENTKLVFLLMHDNKVAGTVPESISSLAGLKVLDISFNEFTGQLPAMNSMDELQYLVTSENNFSEQPMPDLQDLRKLRDLTMKGNKIQGAIPDWIGDLTALTYLDLDANLLTGTIPSQIGKISNLYTLLLNRNDLNGTLPAEMADLLELENVLIDGNDLTGSTSVLCERTDQANLFISDCKETNGQPAQISCPCCTKCCETGDVGCSDFEWSAQLEIIGKNLYRESYFNTTGVNGDFSKQNDENP